MQNYIKNFESSWFAAVMGTGVLAVTSLFYSEYLPILKNISNLLFYFNILLFFVFLMLWILRWIKYPKNMIAELKHPILSSFSPTVAVAMLVLGID